MKKNPILWGELIGTSRERDDWRQYLMQIERQHCRLIIIFVYLFNGMRECRDLHVWTLLRIAIEMTSAFWLLAQREVGLLR